MKQYVFEVLEEVTRLEIKMKKLSYLNKMKVGLLKIL